AAHALARPAEGLCDRIDWRRTAFEIAVPILLRPVVDQAEPDVVRRGRVLPPDLQVLLSVFALVLASAVNEQNPYIALALANVLGNGFTERRSFQDAVGEAVRGDALTEKALAQNIVFVRRASVGLDILAEDAVGLANELGSVRYPA